MFGIEVIEDAYISQQIQQDGQNPIEGLSPPAQRLSNNMEHLEEKHVDTKRGLSYRYYISSRSQADASKPVLLLCHGFPDDAKLWQFIIRHLLRTKLRIIAPDLLGAGGTSAPTDPTKFEISAMVDDILEVLEKERLAENVIPIGHDW